ncbi:hypothetical protein COCMIDRAFT_23916 [Bipolaris oryzae ATCC 44560]|uniref:Uncharacterized protein n=1 Tax=Bipolaris oryzae ATCC 44560 TaxID=930090 RepID=W6ZX15_COCMI|nr:uncharacterized protein COCMIDRAFT_23916 [Bipolaris oryzae ATCC 44560]EUC48376.1 hypothetical protein COCMIDRAFT_23916 [Bipolaris oryzae ATCC 44560]
MELVVFLLVALLSLASATPVLPVVRPFAPSKVVPRNPKFKMPFPTTFYDLPTGDPRSVPLPTGDLGSPPPPWRHENGVGVYKDPHQVAPLWYSEDENEFPPKPKNKNKPDGKQARDSVPTEITKIISRNEVTISKPKVLVNDCYLAARIKCKAVLGLTDCEQQSAKYTILQPVGETGDCIPLEQTGSDNLLGVVNTRLLSKEDVKACWQECGNIGQEACEQCDEKLRLGGLTPSTQPARYDPWGWGPTQAGDPVDQGMVSVGFQMLWKCALNCMRNSVTPCRNCDPLWEESKKVVSSRGFKEEEAFWGCIHDCSRNRLVSCTACEPAWRQQLAMITSTQLSVEQAVAYADIWNCAVHCNEDRTQKMCAPCDELWRKWDAGLPPFGPERTGLLTARVDAGSPSSTDSEEYAIRLRYSECIRLCDLVDDIRPVEFCHNCETILVKSASVLAPSASIRRSISAESSETIARRLLYVWDPVTGAFKCKEQCAKGKDYYISCLPCLYDKGIPVGDNTPQVGQAEVVKTSPEQKSDVLLISS